MKITKDTKIKAVLNADGEFPVIEILDDDGGIVGSSGEMFRGMDAGDAKLVQAARFVNTGLEANRNKIRFGRFVWKSKREFAQNACRAALFHVRRFEDRGDLPSGVFDAVAAVACGIPSAPGPEKLGKAA